jgi:hypothetical protein
MKFIEGKSLDQLVLISTSLGDAIGQDSAEILTFESAVRALGSDNFTYGSLRSIGVQFPFSNLDWRLVVLFFQVRFVNSDPFLNTHFFH